MDNVTAAAVVARDKEIETTMADYSGDDYDYELGDTSMETFTRVVLPTIFSIVCVVGLIGNGLVIYIMHLKVRNLNITDLYVLNLAIADFIFVAMLPFWTTDLALGRWVFGQAMCKITSGLTYFHLYASVFFLTAMSADRFVAVVLYQKCRRTKMCAAATVITLWLIAAILGTVPSYFRGIDMRGDIPKCDWTFKKNSSSDNKWFMTYVVSRSFIGFALPLLIILVCYSLIICFLQARKTSGKLTGKCQDRATRMVLVVIAVFLVCWVPNQVSNLIYVAKSFGIMEYSTKQDIVHYHVHMFSTCLAWMHSCANPILYAFMREDMRLKLTEIMNHNIKRCCGDNSWVDRQPADAKYKSGNQVERRKLQMKNCVDEGTRITQSIRLSTVHKRSLDEGVLNRDQPYKRQISSPEEEEKEKLMEDDVFQATTVDDNSNCYQTTPQCVALMNDNSIKVEVQPCNENEML